MKKPHLQSLFVVAACAVTAIFPACENADMALQEEMATLRERVEQAEAAAEAARAESARTRMPDAGKIKAGLEVATEKMARNVPTALPGYRTQAVKVGPVVYLIEGGENPIRASLEIRVRPTSPSALTPELPPITFVAMADEAGNWQMPGAPELRELQAAASARAVAQADAARRESPPRGAAPATSTGESAPAPPSDPNARVISWGDDSPGPAQAAPQPPAQAPAAAPSSPRLPKADQSYEIRFD